MPLLKSFVTPFVACTLVSIFSWTCVTAADSDSPSSSESTLGDTSALTLFDAIDQQRVEVRYIAISSTQGNLLMRNKGDEPIEIRVPELVGAQPVLGQFAGGQFGAGQIGAGQGFGQQGFGQQGGGAQAGGGASQRVGGAVGQGPGGGNDIGGLFRIGAHKMRKLSVLSVCLDHGKAEPSAKIPYELVPLDSLTSDEELSRALLALRQKELSHQAAQAIAWHRVCGLTWNKLAGLNRTESAYLGVIKFFRKSEIAEAKAFLEQEAATRPSKSELAVNR
ncbi:hypothetical protein [Stieleria varia]|uniref:Secreted protein n=1 Tax=Stieleria varia TaxID=2528005 RepID=A0A5C5ZZV3_9BACT|nr:hypothetical protein [Stieleria varia]TWT92686.1 hypothetical protein Pla52n_60510 [Stieleria varia]